MHPLPNTSDLMNNLLAALMFFTRLPFWRICTVPSECFRHVVSYWSLCGWLTGGVMALSFWGFSTWFPLPVAVLLALCARLFLTGALHEDGLADFFDGFGGGRDREGILRIMKDSHIGSYGVLGLILYYLLSFSLLVSLPVSVIPWVLCVADPFCKFVCSFMLLFLPYARKEEESKAKVVYTRMSLSEWIANIAGGLLPLLLLSLTRMSLSEWIANIAGGLLPLLLLPLSYWGMLCFPCVLFIGLGWLLKRRLGGYTGDCCGALFLLCELTCWMGAVVMASNF